MTPAQGNKHKKTCFLTGGQEKSIRAPSKWEKKYKIRYNWFTRAYCDRTSDWHIERKMLDDENSNYQSNQSPSTK